MNLDANLQPIVIFFMHVYALYRSCHTSAIAVFLRQIHGVQPNHFHSRAWRVFPPALKFCGNRLEDVLYFYTNLSAIVTQLASRTQLRLYSSFSNTLISVPM